MDKLIEALVGLAKNMTAMEIFVYLILIGMFGINILHSRAVKRMAVQLGKVTELLRILVRDEIMKIVRVLMDYFLHVPRTLSKVDSTINGIASRLNGHSSFYLELCDSKKTPECSEPKEDNG